MENCFNFHILVSFCSTCVSYFLQDKIKKQRTNLNIVTLLTIVPKILCKIHKNKFLSNSELVLVATTNYSEIKSFGYYLHS